jgi:AraC-like DNA-binding protein
MNNEFVSSLGGESFITAAESLFDRIPDVVFFVKDIEARYTVVNRTLVERCNVSGKTDLLGKTAMDIFPAPYGQGYYSQDRRVLDNGAPVCDQLELHLYVRGEPGWCITNKVPLRDGDGVVSGLVGLSKDLQTPAEEGKGYQELAKSIRYIQSRFGESLRVEELATMSSLSVYQFEQRMKKIFFLTAGQFITKTRIDKARELLKSTDQSIADVAAACGFFDQSAFTRQFKATTGLTPGKYRTQENG